MKNFIIEMWNDGPFEKIVLFITILLVGFVGWILFMAIDEIGIDSHREKATMIKRTYSAPYTTMVASGTKGAMVPMYVPARHGLVVHVINEGFYDCEVEPFLYNNSKKGDQVTAFIGATRLTNNKICTNAQ